MTGTDVLATGHAVTPAVSMKGDGPHFRAHLVLMSPIESKRAHMMRNETSNGLDHEQRRLTILRTAQAQADALQGTYRDTLTTFMSIPGAVPIPRAARALFWLGRLRQWQAIDLDHRDSRSAAPDWHSFQLGVIESMAGTHALALHKEQWNGLNRRQAYAREMSLQVAMLLALDWRALAAFALQAWFGISRRLPAQPPLCGMTGMIVGIAGTALGIPVPQSVFCRSDSLLGRLAEHWQDDDKTFAPLAGRLIERRLARRGRKGGASHSDFDHPVEQAIPVEILMLLRLRGLNQVPGWLAKHRALSHPAAALVHANTPALSRRSIGFVERVDRLLPRYRGLIWALDSQAEILRNAAT